MGATHILDELMLKIFRADKHIRDFEEDCEKTKRQFINSISFKDDEKTGDRSYYLGNAGFIDDMISLVVGDALHNLRCALDHLAHHLVRIGTKSPGPFDDVCFPIGNTLTNYEDRLRKIIGRLEKCAVGRINAIEPYKGGKGHDLWILRRLDDVDKHRVKLSANCTNLFHTMPPSQRKDIAEKFLGLPADAPIPSGKRFMTSSEGVHLLSLKGGEDLCTVPKAEVEGEMDFTFDITFDEPGVIEGESVRVTLHRMSDLVRGIIHDFDCRGLLA